MTAPESADQPTESETTAADEIVATPETPVEPLDVPPGVPADHPGEGPTWEDDETSAGFFLRAVAALLCGGYLAWAQCHSAIDPHYEWPRWIKLSVAAKFVLPLGIIWLFFGQGIVHLDWLKEQRSNAWNYGWSFGNWRRHGKWALTFAGAMLLVMVVFRFFTPDGKAAALWYKTSYFSPINSAADMAMLLTTLAVYMFCWEFFFRGFLLFGMTQGFGSVLAVIAQAVLFGMTHLGGKPIAEAVGAFGGGLILGALCWKEKSFAPAFYTHALIHLLWAILVYL